MSVRCRGRVAGSPSAPSRPRPCRRGVFREGKARAGLWCARPPRRNLAASGIGCACSALGWSGFFCASRVAAGAVRVAPCSPRSGRLPRGAAGLRCALGPAPRSTRRRFLPVFRGDRPSHSRKFRVRHGSPTKGISTRKLPRTLPAKGFLRSFCRRTAGRSQR